MKQFKNKSLGILGLLALFGVMPAWAVTVPNLYQATVPASVTANTQAAAAQTALPQVLVKVSGNNNITQVPAIAAALPKAGNLVQQSTTTTSGFKIQFDPKAINQLLQQSGQPIWSHKRPLVMVWLSIDRGNGPTLIGSSSADVLPSVVTTQAAVRGLPVILPVLDLQDLTAVNVSDVANNVTGVIQAASTRYASDVELIGRITTAGPTLWNVSWTLVFNDQANQEIDSSTTAADLNTLVQAMVNNATNALAARYATATRGAASTLTPVRMTVGNVNGLSAYAKVLDYLNGLGPVKQAQVLQVDSSHIELELSVDGGVNALTQALALDTKLTPVANPNTIVGQTPEQSTAAPAQLDYQWAE